MNLTFRDIENKNKVIEGMKNTLKTQSEKIEHYENLIGAIANIDGAFITGEGECDFTDKQALDKIMEWVEPIWNEIAQKKGDCDIRNGDK